MRNAITPFNNLLQVSIPWFVQSALDGYHECLCTFEQKPYSSHGSNTMPFRHHSTKPVPAAVQQPAFGFRSHDAVSHLTISSYRAYDVMNRQILCLFGKKDYFFISVPPVIRVDLDADTTPNILLQSKETYHFGFNRHIRIGVLSVFRRIFPYTYLFVV